MQNLMLKDVYIKLLQSPTNAKKKWILNMFFFLMLLIPQILTESLPVKHILFISFQIHCSGAKKMCRCPNIYGSDCKIESS